MIKTTLNKLHRKIIIISTFNGIGSTSESLKQLGRDTDVHTICEIDKHTNETYFHNFPENKDKLVEDIRDLEQNIEEGLKLDLLVQTPPCQSFSISGKREGFKSDNGNLFIDSINLQKKVDSTIVIYENVKGLISHDKKVGKYKSLINKEYDGKKKTIGHTLYKIEELLLQDTRYNYYWKVINSCDQGLPQNRERIFIVGIKKEHDKGFKFPDNKDIEFTVEDILEKNVPKNLFYKNKANHKLIPTCQTKRKNRIHTISNYDEKTMSYESTRRVYSPYVSPCITTGNNSKFMIDGRVRRLSTTELKRIHGFREEYEFVGSNTQQYKQLGNTVSPGVYNRLFTEIFNSVSLDKPINNVEYRPKRTHKKTIVVDNHINIVKKITNTPDLNYLNLTQKRYEEYKTHLSNGGTMSMTVEFYDNVENKRIGNIQDKIITHITDIEQLGFRNKKSGVYRCKITGTRNQVQNGIQEVNNTLELNDKKMVTVMNETFKEHGFTLNTMIEVKKNPELIIEQYRDMVLNPKDKEILEDSINMIQLNSLDDTINMIRSWSYLLNRYNVELENENIFTLSINNTNYQPSIQQVS